MDYVVCFHEGEKALTVILWILAITLTCLLLMFLSIDKKMIPIENYGVKCMSMGSLVEEGAAIVWRGPMVYPQTIFVWYLGTPFVEVLVRNF